MLVRIQPFPCPHLFNGIFIPEEQDARASLCTTNCKPHDSSGSFYLRLTYRFAARYGEPMERSALEHGNIEAVAAAGDAIGEAATPFQRIERTLERARECIADGDMNRAMQITGDCTLAERGCAESGDVLLAERYNVLSSLHRELSETMHPPAEAA